MKTILPKISKRPLILTVSAAALLGLLTGEAVAQERVWNLAPGSANWNTAGNWTAPNVPNAAGETARFQLSGTTNLNIAAASTVSPDGILFDAGASAFVINHGALATLNLNGAGIVNNSGIVQTINNNSALSQTVFNNSASAGRNVVINNSAALSSTTFNGSATAGAATISSTAALASTVFNGNATAGTATITNSGAGSFTSFNGNATGGQATLINTVAGALVDISGLTTAGMTVGAISGKGNFYLGSKNLEVGGNNASTEVTGVIRDGGPFSAAVGGSLTKTGTGRLTLSGANLYTGNTTVNAGELLVNGSTVSRATTVNLEGLLGGVGTVGGQVINRGTVSPGNSPGTLKVTGNYAQESSGTLRIEVASTTQFDQLRVGGVATLGGTLTAVGVDGYAPKRGDVVTFLTAAGGVTGTFAELNDEAIGNGTILRFALRYDASQVSLEFVQGSFAALPDLTPNQHAVAVALDDVAFVAEPPEFIDYLNQQSVGALPAEFDRIAPEELTSVFNIANALANVQMTNLQRRLEDVRGGSTGFSGQRFALQGSAPDFQGGFGLAGVAGPDGKSCKSGCPIVSAPENRWGFFASGSGEFIDVENQRNANGYDFASGGITLGVDYRVCANFAVGFTVGYAHTGVDLNDDGHLSADGGRIGLYATTFGHGFYLDAAVSVGLNGYDTRRAALDGSAYGDTDGTEIDVFVGAGYDWKRGALTVGPIANFQYTYLDLDGFTEHGSLVPLKYGSQSGESIRTTFGLKASYDWMCHGRLIRPQLRVSWQHEYGDTAATLSSQFATGGPTFTVAGPDIGADSLLIGAGFSIQWSETVSLFLYYDGEFGRSDYRANSISGGFRVEF